MICARCCDKSRGAPHMRFKQSAVKQALHQRAVQFASQHTPGKNLRIAYGYARG